MSVRTLTKCVLKMKRAYSNGVKPLSDYDKMHKNPLVSKQKMIPKAHYGGRHTVTMLPGAGLGPEMMGHVKTIFSLITMIMTFLAARQTGGDSKVLEIHKIKNSYQIRYRRPGSHSLARYVSSSTVKENIVRKPAGPRIYSERCLTAPPGQAMGSPGPKNKYTDETYIGAPVDFEEVDIDLKAENEKGVRYAIDTIKRNGVALKGNIETRSKKAMVTSWNILLRNELDLFAYLIRCKSYKGLQNTKHKDVDLVVVRQNTEGEYSMLEHESVKGVVESMKVITRSNSERVARFAFEYARAFGRKKITTIHKANIMKIADGLFLQTSRDIAKEYPDIEHNDMIIDNCCMQLVAKPHQFDMLLMINLYGSVVINVICGMLGGAGVYAGRNYGYNYAVFEPGTRHTGNHLVGKNVANPVAMVGASIAMLDHLGHTEYSELLSRAVDKTINEDWIVTRDCGGKASTTDVVKAIIANCSVVAQKKTTKK